MQKKIKILCPNITVDSDANKQILRPGIHNSNKCELVSTPCDNGFIRSQKCYDRWLKDNVDDTDVVIITDTTQSDFAQHAADRYPDKPVILVSYNDTPICNFEPVIKPLPGQKITRFKRSMVDFEWCRETNSKVGTIIKYPYPVHHTAFCVREDITTLTKGFNTGLSFKYRPYDVSCFFPTIEKPNSYPRNYIGNAVNCFDNLKTHVGYTTSDNSSPQRQGRQGIDLHDSSSAQFKYIKTATCSKIIVTACPANYEGDYRLMEAMQCGALVLHNKMMTIPKGLVDGKHWVLYDNEEDLKNKITYYTKNIHIAAKIAAQGKRFVLDNHRPHHRVEQWLKIAGVLK